MGDPFFGTTPGVQKMEAPLGCKFFQGQAVNMNPAEMLDFFCYISSLKNFSQKINLNFTTLIIFSISSNKLSIGYNLKLDFMPLIELNKAI
ncbi:hypothetical protein ACFIJ5_03530 [Haloimpatiens sp. FM7330]|uniref:hypothetical protein n=1 Tax=Haloimpatiens sp. FM7330 TaxID=3298610 RepID=UPI003634ED84